ncbi:MAG TPA: hypothetical protein VEJ43_17040 [Pseudolabrys sp.]|nr:hypothetical protein [Pseudolabrys sp.]
MCIACELGYWMMIDALEAERAAKGDVTRGQSDFACDAPSGPVPHPSETVTDERTP